MTSKQRVLLSIEHKNVDKTPYFYLGEPDIDKLLSEQLGIRECVDVHSVATGNQWSITEENLLQKLEVDVRYVEPQLVEVSGENRYNFSLGAVHAKLHNQPHLDEQANYPLEGVLTVGQLDEWKWPDPDWFDYEIPENLVASWKDKAVVAYNMGILFLVAMGVRGMEQIMIDMMIDKKLAHEIFRRIGTYNTERSRRFLEANKGVIDILGIGDEVAGQMGMVVSPDLWREFMKPYLEDMVALCRDFSVVPYYHGCGGFVELYPDFIDMGITCTGRLQTEARGNNFADIKKCFGKDLCLWGAIDGQHILIEGSPEQVRSHVRNILEVGSYGSGFIAGPTHSFTADTPIENIVAVFEVLNQQKF